MQLFSVFATIGLRDEGFQDGINNATQQGEGFGSSFASVGKTIGKAALAIGAAVKGIGIAALRVGGDYERSMRAIQAQTGMVDDDISMLGYTFRDMAFISNYSAREIAAAFENIAVAGNDVNYAIDIMSKSIVLADVVGGDLGSTARFLGDYLAKVGKDSSYAERYINIFAATVQKTGIDLNRLQKYLFNANITLQATNITGEEASIMFGKLYRAGVYGARAYSGIEAATRSLLQPTQEQIIALERLGVAREDENGQLRDGIPFLMDVANALSGLEGAQLSYYNSLLGSTQMGSDFLGGLVDIRGTLPDAIDNMYELSKATDGTGIAFEMAAKRQLDMNQAMGMAQAAGADMLKTIFSIIQAPFAETVGRAAEKMRDLALRMREGGDLHPLIQNLAQAFSTLVETLMGLVVRVIPVLVQVLSTAAAGLTGLLNVVNSILPVIGALVGSFVTYKVTLKAISFAGFLKNMALKTIAIGKAATAQKGLNTAMKANPIGLAAGLATLLTTGVMTLVNHIRRGSEAFREMSGEVERLARANRDLRNSINDTHSSMAETIRHQHDEHVVRQNLIQQIRELMDLEYRTAEQKQEIIALTGLLNHSMGESIVSYDKEADAISRTADELEKLVDLRNHEEQVTLGREWYLQLYEQRLEAERQLVAALEHRAAVEERNAAGAFRNETEYLEALREADAAVDALNENLDYLNNRMEWLLPLQMANEEAVSRLTTELGLQVDAVDDLGFSFENLGDLINETANIYEEYENRVRETLSRVTGLSEEATETQVRLALERKKADNDTLRQQKENASALGMLHDDYMEKLREVERAQEQFAKETERTMGTHKRTLLNIFGYISTETDRSMQDVFNALWENERAMVEWFDNLEILVARGLDPRAIEKFIRQGPEKMAAYVKMFAESSASDFQTLRGLVEGNLYTMADTAEREMALLGKVFYEVGSDMADNLAQGMADNTVADDARDMASEATTAIEREFAAVPQVAERSLIDAARVLTDYGVTMQRNMDAIGRAAGAGFRQGLLQNLEDAVQRGMRILDDFVRQARQTLQVRSPSRIFEYFGRMVGAGLDRGLDTSMGAAAKTFSSYVNKMGGMAMAGIGGYSPRYAPEYTLAGGGAVSHVAADTHYHITVENVEVSADSLKSADDVVKLFVGLKEARTAYGGI